MKITNQTIQQITTKVEIERIYQFSYHFLDQKYHRLLIVLNSKCNVPPATLETAIDMCLAEEAPLLTYMLIPSGELNRELKNGNLFYTCICTIKNLLYDDGKKKLLLQTRKEIEIIQIKASQHFLIAEQKALDFALGMDFYAQKGKLHQVAFMLHQSAEITFRAFNMAVFNKNKPSHSLNDHLNLFSRFLPALRSVFPKDDIYEYGLLKLLDKAYVSVRYKNDYVIKKEELLTLINKTKLLVGWCRNFFNECLQVLENLKVEMPEIQELSEATPDAVMSITPEVKVVPSENKAGYLNKIQQKQMDTVVNNIRKKHKILQIIFLGAGTALHQKNILYNENQQTNQSCHCFLLAIISNGTNATSRTIIENDLKVTVVFHPQHVVHFSLEKRNRFFIQALNKGQLLYSKPETLITFNIPEPDWKHSYESADKFHSYQLNHLANMFYESANAVQDYVDSNTEACLVLLSQCVEHVCASFIYIHTGYRTNQYDLPFLFDLCEMISSDVSLNMHQNTIYDKRLIGALINSAYNIRHNSTPQMDYGDIRTLLKRCEVLIEIVQNSCQTELERLKKLAHPEEEKLTA